MHACGTLRHIPVRSGIPKYLGAAKEGGWVAAGQLATVTITAVTAKVLTTQLGPEDYGLLALAMTTQLLFAQVIFTPLSSGVALYLMPLARVGREGELHIILERALRRILAAFAVLAAAAGVIAAVRWGPNLGLLASGGILYGVLLGAVSPFLAIQTAARRRVRAALLLTLPPAARLVGSLMVIVLIDARPSLVVTAMALATGAVLVPQVVGLRVLAKRASAGGVVPSAELSRDTWRLARHFSIWGAFYAAQLVSDVWALKLTAGDRLVGTYAFAVLISSSLVFVAAVITQSIHPVVYERAGLGAQSAETGRAWPVLRFGVAAMLIVTLIAALGSAVFGHSIVLLLSDHEYLGAAEVLPLIMLGVGLREAAHISAASFYVRRATREFLILRICVSVLTILANLVGALSAGLTGVAMASAASGALYLGALTWAERRGTREAGR